VSDHISYRELDEGRGSTAEREEALMPTTPQVGRRAPSFTLTDTSGEKIRLSDYRGQKNVLLVFNRGFV
jgi:peroxiredoxin